MTNLNSNITQNLNAITNTPSPAPANKLEEKLSDWIEQVEAGKPDYCAVTMADSKMYYVSKNTTAELLSVDMLSYNDNGFERDFSYRKKDDLQNASVTPFTAIFKKESKLIINNNGKLSGFGFKDSSGSQTKLTLLHFHMSQMHIIITASNTAESIEVIYAWNYQSTDPIKLCMHALFDSVTKRKEV